MYYVKKYFKKTLTLQNNEYLLLKESLSICFLLLSTSSIQKTFSVLLKCTFLSLCFHHGTKKNRYFH